MHVEVSVRFFAAYREVTGLGAATIRLPAGATVADLVARVMEAHPQLAAHRDSMILAVNREFADIGTELRAGDEVALLPPVSGGVGLCRVQAGSIEAQEVLDMVRDVRAGAVILFLGTVRADPGVAALDYEAYEPMAVDKMEALRAAAKSQFGVTEVAIVHRTGRLGLGETAMAIACGAPHRREALRACEWMIEELKTIVPIWKTER